VVYTDGDREWLLMNSRTWSETSIDEPAWYTLITLKTWIDGDGTFPGLRTSDQLDWLRDHYKWIVWDLEKPEQILDPFPLTSVSCPRCSPTGMTSSWMLDCRKIALALVEGRSVDLLATSVLPDGDVGPVSDRDLGYSPNNRPPLTMENLESWREFYENRPSKGDTFPDSG
jgi:hypothetical protein